MIDMWRDIVMKAVLERFSPVVLKVLSDERVQALLTQALNLQADMRENIEAQVKLVARTLELVTRDELASLRAVVKELEAEVSRLREALAKERAAREAAEKDHAATHASSAAPFTANQPTPPPKKTFTRAKKTAA